MSQTLRPLTMPKWGLSMQEGKVTGWLLEEGTTLSPGDEVLEVETDKILAGVEAHEGGVLCRQVASEEETLPVGALLAVIGAAETPKAEIDTFVADFRASYVPPAPETLEEELTQSVEILGRSIRYLKRGDNGSPVMLIHGFGGDLNNWLFNHEALATQHVVYALDLPGHGASTKQVEQGTLDELAGVVVGFLEAMEIQKAHLVGHSMGGAIALTLARNHPERVHSLALIGSAGLGTEIDGSYLEGFVASQKRKDLKPHLQKLFSNPALITRQFVEDVLRFKRIDGVKPALESIANQFCTQGRQSVQLRDQLADLEVPRLVIWGEEDRIIPASHGQGIATEVQLEILPGAGHMVQMEASAQVNRLLLAHLGAL